MVRDNEVRMIRTALLLAAAAAAAAQTPCDQLKSLKLADTTVTMAENVPAGEFRNPTPPVAGKQPPAPLQVPAFCRFAATLKPTADSLIDIEVWLPANWNGKYQAVGGGGWAGIISYPALATALNEGYATSSTDTGHKGGDATFTIGHPEKVVDFAYRAIHEMALKSKDVIKAHYGRAPRLSYFNGCSTGGRQGLMEAQRFPEDFDAILSGAPANYHIHLHSYDLNWAQTYLKDPSYLVPAAKLALLNRAVLAACDARDGVKDSLLNDPRQCKFDPSTLLCKGADAPDCLTASQLETIKTGYAPVKTKAGQLIFPGLAPGGETGWTRVIADTAPMGVSIGSYRHLLYQDPAWDWRKFDLDRDTAAADEKYGYINAVNPDLSAFKKRGGKLLMYHGWNDPLISPENSINYYSSVLAKMGQKQDDWLRLFMVPAMGHCNGGPGPNQFNIFGSLERWKEAGEAPAQIRASRVANNRVDMTRPLCPYPQVAAYKGVGSTNDAANFACKAP
jgi:feruloyl esterase